MQNKFSEKQLIQKKNKDYELETAYELGVEYQRDLIQFQMDHKDYIKNKNKDSKVSDNKINDSQKND